MKREFSLSRRAFVGSALSGLAAVSVADVVYGAGGATIKIAASRNAAAPVWNLATVAPKFGFNVEMSILFTYAEQMRAASNGQTNAATCGIDTMATVADQNIGNLRYIFANQYGAQNIVLRTGVQASKWSDLEGKKIGVVPGTWARVQFLIAAKEGGADVGKIELVNVSVGATATETLRRGDVDGVVLFSPQCDQMVVTGVGYYPEKLDIGACSLGNANSGVLATTDLLADKELSTNFAKAYLESMAQVRDQEYFKKLVVSVTGVTPEVAAQAFRSMVFSEKIDVKAIVGAAKLGPQFGFTKADQSGKVESLIDFGPLMAATGKSRDDLIGPPKEALAIIRK
jgi:sulfonate transport system substrate-binding protein